MKKISKLKDLNILTYNEQENISGGNWLSSLVGGILAGWNHDVPQVSSTISFEFYDNGTSCELVN